MILGDSVTIGGGGASASILAQGQLTSADSCYAVKDGVTYNGVWTTIGTTSGFLISNLKEYGTYTVTATQGSNTETVDVLVDSAERYDIEIEFSKTYLYNLGDECTSITGGWDLGNFTFSWYSMQAFTKNSDNIYTSKSTGSTSIRAIGATNLIDFTNYSLLKISCNMSYIEDVAYRSGLQVQCGTSLDIEAQTSIGSINSIGEQTFSFDISSISGSKYLTLFNFCDGYYYATGNIHSIWLE